MKCPDMSREGALSDDQPPVLLNGMKVVFDQKVALYPVRLEKKNEEGDSGERESQELGAARNRARQEETRAETEHSEHGTGKLAKHNRLARSVGHLQLHPEVLAA